MRLCAALWIGPTALSVDANAQAQRKESPAIEGGVQYNFTSGAQEEEARRTKKISAEEVSVLQAQAKAQDTKQFFRNLRLDNVRDLRALLLRGFDPDIVYAGDGTPALIFALREASYACAQQLIATARMDFNRVGPSGENALMLAVLREQTELVSMLLAKGVEVNKPGWTPLHYAATRGHEALMHLLLERSAYLDAQAPNGNTPLHMAVVFGTEGAARLLLEEGADATLKNHAGQTAADSAQAMGKDSLFVLLQDHALRQRVQQQRDAAKTRQSEAAAPLEQSAPSSAPLPPAAPLPVAPMRTPVSPVRPRLPPALQAPPREEIYHPIPKPALIFR